MKNIVDILHYALCGEHIHATISRFMGFFNFNDDDSMGCCCQDRCC